MAENSAADRLRGLLHDAQCEELDLATTRAGVETKLPSGDQGGRHDVKAESGSGSGSGSSAEELLCLLEASLSGPAAEALDSLASSAVLLGCATTAAPSIGQALRSEILRVSQETFALEAQIRSLDEQVARLQTLRPPPQQDQRASSMANDVSSGGLNARPQSQYNPFLPTIDLESASAGTGIDGASGAADDPNGPDDTSDSATLHAQTQRHQLETKQLELKAQEYADRIAQLTPHPPRPQPHSTASKSISIADVAAKQQRLETQADEVQRLESAIRAFHGLPPDVEASRSEVKRAMLELEALKRRRDGEFEMLAR